MLKGVFSRCLFLPFCCSIPCASTSCEVVRVKAIMAKKTALTCSDLGDHVNVYASNSAETGAICWVWRECKIKRQCQFKVFTENMVLEDFCVYKT